MVVNEKIVKLSEFVRPKGSILKIIPSICLIRLGLIEWLALCPLLVTNDQVE